MICHSRNGGRYSTGHCLLIDAAHHIVHRSGNVLSNSTANSHTRHHSSHIETITAAAKIYIASFICSHLSEGVCSGNTDLCLLLNLKSPNIGGLCLLVLCVLTFFTLDAKCFFIVLRFDALFGSNILNSGFGFCFCSRSGKFFGYAHQPAIAFARLVNLYRPNVNSRNKDTKIFFQSFAYVI